MLIYPSRVRWIVFLAASLLLAAAGAAVGWIGSTWLLRLGGWLLLLPAGVAAAGFSAWVLHRREPALMLTLRGIWVATGLFSPPRLIAWSSLRGVGVERRFGLSYLSLSVLADPPRWLHGNGRVRISPYELDRPAAAVAALLGQYIEHETARRELPDWEPGRLSP